MERLFKHKDFWNDFFLRTVHDNNLLFKIFYKFYRIYRPSGLVLLTDDFEFHNKIGCLELLIKTILFLDQEEVLTIQLKCISIFQISSGDFHFSQTLAFS